MKRYTLYSSSELETIKLACSLAKYSEMFCNIYLYGQIGLGKTSFCKGFLKGLGYCGHVCSPSYTLVESYILTSFVVYHFDFYRLHAVEEIENIGIRDYFDSCAVRLVEWPNLMKGILPKEDIAILLESCHSFSMRKITLEGFTYLGKSILQRLFDSKKCNNV